MKAPLAFLTLLLAALCGQVQTLDILSTFSTNPGGPISVPSGSPIPSSPTGTTSGVSAPSTLPGGNFSSLPTSVPTASGSGGVTTSGSVTLTTATSTSTAATASSTTTKSNAASSDRIGAAGTFAGLFVLLAAAAF